MPLLAMVTPLSVVAVCVPVMVAMVAVSSVMKPGRPVGQVAGERRAGDLERATAGPVDGDGSLVATSGRITPGLGACGRQQPSMEDRAGGVPTDQALGRVVGREPGVGGDAVGLGVEVGPRGLDRTIDSIGAPTARHVRLVLGERQRRLQTEVTALHREYRQHPVSHDPDHAEVHPVPWCPHLQGLPRRTSPRRSFKLPSVRTATVTQLLFLTHVDGLPGGRGPPRVKGL
jgi:hypothetical protein